MTWKQQTLVLLLTEPGEVSESELLRWLEHPKLSDLRRNVLNPFHKLRIIEYDVDARTIRLLPPGVRAAEELVAAVSYTSPSAMTAAAWALSGAPADRLHCPTCRWFIS